MAFLKIPMSLQGFRKTEKEKSYIGDFKCVFGDYVDS